MQEEPLVTGAKNVSFAKNILALTGETELSKVQGRWAFSEFKVLKEEESAQGGRCQLCHSAINIAAQIERVDDRDVRALIGRDCMEKLNVFNETGEVRSLSSGEMERYGKTRREEILSGLRDAGIRKPQIASVISWLKQERQLPKRIRETLAWLEKLGYPPTRDHALELVEYYKAHRPFTPEAILTREELQLFNTFGRDLKLGRAYIYLNDLGRIRSALELAESERVIKWQHLWEMLCCEPVQLSLFSRVYVDGNELHFVFEDITIRAAGELRIYEIKAPYFEDLFYLQVRFVGCTHFYPERNEALVEIEQQDLIALVQGANDNRMAAIHAGRAEAARRREIRSKLVNYVVENGLATSSNAFESHAYADRVDFETDVDGVTIVVRLPAVFSAAEYQACWPDTFRFEQGEVVTSEDCGQAVLRIASNQWEEWSRKLASHRRITSSELRRTLDRRLHGLLEKQRIVRGRFEQSPNPHTGKMQWEAKRGRETYVLISTDSYEPAMGEVYCGLIRVLVTDKVFLVGLVSISEADDGHLIASVNNEVIADSRASVR